jgi:hypothetical protein
MTCTSAEFFIQPCYTRLYAIVVMCDCVLEWKGSLTTETLYQVFMP